MLLNGESSRETGVRILQAHRVPGDSVTNARQQVSGDQADVASRTDDRERVAEKAGEGVGGQCHVALVGLALARIGVEGCLLTGVSPRLNGIGDNFGQYGNIA